jgi:hypothetical protein
MTYCQMARRTKNTQKHFDTVTVRQVRARLWRDSFLILLYNSASLSAPSGFGFHESLTL